MTERRYSVILLDVDGTLLDFRLCAAEAMAQAAAACGISLPPEANDTFHTVNDELWRRLERGELTRDRLYAIRFTRLFEVLSVDYDGPTFEGVFHRFLETTAVPVEGAADLLAYLRERYTLCVASNARPAQQLQRLQRAGMAEAFAHFFCTDKPEQGKPNARFFDECLAALGGVDKRQVLMIGDSPTADIEGAGNAGIDACWFDPGRIPYTFRHPPLYRVEALRDIRRIL